MRLVARAAPVAAVLASTMAATAGAAPIPAKVNLVGLTCAKPIQIFYDRDGPSGRKDKPVAMHPLDDHWVSVSIKHAPTGGGREHFDVAWRLRPEVELCANGWTKFGGASKKIPAPTGSLSADVAPNTAAKAKFNVRFREKIEMRDDLGRARIKQLVAGWVRRSCRLESSDPDAAELLADLAQRAGAIDCKVPRRPRGTAVQLLDHLVAYFNAQGFKGNAKLGREYYRVLAQFTTFRAPLR